MSPHVRLERTGPGGVVARVTLARPEAHNAFDASLIAELRTVFAGLAREPAADLRAVVLAGDGPSFCAGADIAWMRAAMSLDVEGNEQDAMAMADTFELIDTCPAPVIARVHGAALGGGMGLCAVSDVVIAESGTRFGFTETRLGILPAVISPYVIAKIGESHARALFPGGRRFDATRAARIGLVHEIVEGEVALDAAVDAAIADLLASDPRRHGPRRPSCARFGVWATVDEMAYRAAHRQATRERRGTGGIWGLRREAPAILGPAGRVNADSGLGPADAEAEPVGEVHCYGCGALVPDVTWPTHRYVGASPGCWAIYAEVFGGGLLPPLPAPYGALIVDAYGRSIPACRGRSRRQSVWVHLIALQLVFEGGWPASQLVRIRKAVGDLFPDLPWLEPPPFLGEVTFPDLDEASEGPLDDLTKRWVDGVWEAWAVHHDAVRARASDLVTAFD